MVVVPIDCVKVNEVTLLTYIPVLPLHSTALKDTLAVGQALNKTLLNQFKRVIEA